MKGLIPETGRLSLSEAAAKQLGVAHLSPEERAAKREQDRLAAAAEAASARAEREAKQKAHEEMREQKKLEIKAALEADAMLEASLELYRGHQQGMAPLDAKIKQLSHVIDENLKSIEELSQRISELQLRKERIVAQRNRDIDARTAIQESRKIDNTQQASRLKELLMTSNEAWAKIQPAKRKELRNRKAKKTAIEILGPDAPAQPEE